MNWQRVAAVNASKIEREGNLQAVKRFIPEVAVGRVNSHDVDTNPGLLNAFRLAQLQVQYVLHCQQVRHRDLFERSQVLKRFTLYFNVVCVITGDILYSGSCNF